MPHWGEPHPRGPAQPGARVPDLPDYADFLSLLILCLTFLGWLARIEGWGFIYATRRRDMNILELRNALHVERKKVRYLEYNVKDLLDEIKKKDREWGVHKIIIDMQGEIASDLTSARFQLEQLTGLIEGTPPWDRAEKARALISKVHSTFTN